ncbi:MAG: 30S ribosomal protein S15 [Halothece sp.]
MSLSQENKQEIINNYQVHETDTGSTEVQVAIMTKRITRLTEHLKHNNQDHASRRGLLQLIGHRRSLLSYLQKEDQERYQNLIKRLGIRG